MKAYLMRIAVLALGALYVATAPAQYPVWPIKLLVPISAGGAPDVAARVPGQKLAESMGQQIVVENRTGSNGNIAADLVAKSPADGYTLLLAPDSLFTLNPHLYAKMPFDPLVDLVAVASIASNQYILSVNPSLPVNNFNEFIEYARRAKPPLAFASGGNSSGSHLSLEMLKARAGIEFVHVPYKGGTPATTATVAGETAATFAGASSAGQIKAGRLRALAQTSARRSAAFPNLPSVGEIYPGFDVTTWYGVFAPAGTPEPVLARLRTEVARVLAHSDLKERLNAAGGMEPYATKVEEFVALMRRDHDRFGKLIKELKISLD